MLVKVPIRQATSPPVIPLNTGWELNRYLYARLGPGPAATPLERGAWRRDVLPALVAMARSESQEEIRLLIERHLPHVDVSRSPLTSLVQPRDRDRRQDRPVGTIIPDPEKIRSEAPSERVYQLLAALIVSTGRVDYAAGAQLEVRVPSRQLGELIGTSHQYVCALIQRSAERSQIIRRRQPTRCNDGRGLAGINPATGGRRGAPAHPATLYQLTIDQKALQLAQDYVAEHGYPETTFLAQVITAPVEIKPEEVKAAREEWIRILATLAGNSATHPERIRRLLAPLEPVALREESGRMTLTLAGRWHHLAADLIQRVCDYQLRILIRPPGG